MSEAQSTRFYRVAWNPINDIIAASDGYTLGIYTSNFSLIDSASLHGLPSDYIHAHNILWSPDGSKIAVNISGMDIDPIRNTNRILQLWNWNGSNLHKITDIPAIHLPTGDDVAWHPDSTRFAAVEFDLSTGTPWMRISIYDATNGTLLAILETDTPYQSDHIGWSPDGNQIVFDTRGHELQVWDATNQEFMGIATDNFNTERRMAYSPIENHVALFGLDSYTEIKIWDTNTFQLIQTLEHPASVRSFTWGTGGLVSTAADGMMRVWDVTTGQVSAMFPTGTTIQLYWNPSGTQLVMFDMETRLIYIRDATSGDILVTFDPSNIPPTADAGANGLATQTPPDAQEPEPFIVSSPEGSILDIEYSPDGTMIALVYTEGRVVVRETSSDTIIFDQTLRVEYLLIRARVAWSPTGDRLAAGVGSYVYIWDASNFTLIQSLMAGSEEALVYQEQDIYYPAGFYDVEWSRDGEFLFSSSVNTRYAIWSFQNNIFIVDKIVGGNPSPAVLFTNDQRISTGSHYFDIQTQTFTRLNASHYYCTRPTVTMKINSTRTLLAIGGLRGCVSELDPIMGQETTVYQLYEDGNIRAVAWSPDDSMIAAVDTAGRLYQIERSTGEFTVLADVGTELYAVDWSSDGGQIAYGGAPLASGEDNFNVVSLAGDVFSIGNADDDE